MGVRFIDSHSHLYADEFQDDMAEVIQSVKDAGVYKVLLPNIERGSFEAMMHLSATYKELCLPMMGLHPCSVNESTYKDELAFVAEKLNQHEFKGVGEIGMDLYWDKTTQKIQEEALVYQFELALKHELPVALHTRNATKEVIELVETLNDRRLTGVFHCFGDGIDEAHKIIDLGFKLGIGGVLTFKNSGLDKVIKEIDLEHLILETDSPYLAPTPYRGKRNESAYIPIIAQKLADVKEVSIEEVSEITSQNAEQLFSI